MWDLRPFELHWSGLSGGFSGGFSGVGISLFGLGCVSGVAFS